MKRFLLVAVFALAAATATTAFFAQTGSLKLPPHARRKLPNGMTLLLMERHALPLVSFHVIVGAGPVADPPGQSGLASVAAELLRKGTATRTAAQFSEQLDFVGGRFNAYVASDYTSISAEVMKKDLGAGLDLLADALQHAVFPPQEVAKLLQLRVGRIKSAKDQAQAVLPQYFSAFLYGAHPYARPEGGDENSLPAIKRDAIVQFYSANYTAANTILAVVGDFDAAAMEKMLEQKFGPWPAGQPPAITLPAQTEIKGKRLLLVDKPDATQTYYSIGNVGVSRTNPDRVPIDVVNTVFGGRFASLLNSELRIKTGLTYGARSYFDERKSRGPFVISTYTRTATTEKAIDLTLEVLRRLHEKGFTQDDLDLAKNYIKGQFPPSIETSGQLASQLAELEFYGLDEREINDLYPKIDAMTLADAQRIIRQYYPLDNLVFVVIGKASEIGSVVRKYAPEMKTVSISEAGFGDFRF